MKTVVVWDIETQSSFASTRGDTHEEKLWYMEPSVVVACQLIIDETSDDPPSKINYHHFWRDDNRSTSPFAKLLELFDVADVICAFHGIGFDHPVLRKSYGPKSCARAASRYAVHMLKTFDPCNLIQISYGVRVSLDSLLRDNGLSSKISNGLEAIRMWENDRRDELLEYCKSDVELLTSLILLDSPVCNFVPGRRLKPGCVSVKRHLEQKQQQRAERTRTPPR